MVKIELLRKLELFQPTTYERAGDKLLYCSLNKRKQKYYKVQSEDYFCDHFYHFPIVIDADGSLWVEASRYLLSRLSGVIPSKHRTLESIANDLAHFRKWLVKSDVDFLNITPRPRARPTYRYAFYLQEEVQLGYTQTSTAKRRISNIQGFYRWLVEDGFQFNHPLWRENDLNISFKDSHGFNRLKKITSTDLTQSFRTPKNKDEYSKYLNDGGKLRPLPKEEQVIVIKALKNIGNIEMTLSFLLALTTGARLQTVFTFREQSFNQIVHENSPYYRVNVGGRTLIDTKYSKEIVLHIPSWLYQRVQVYLASDRYNSRVMISKHIPRNEGEQYAFLTRTGKPYYMANNDDFAFLYHSPPRGNSVTQFIRQQLKPKLKESGHDFEFHFHDLRASFGMNLLEEKLNDFQVDTKICDSKKPEFFQILMYVRTRMGHSHIRTTEAYLNYKQKYNIALHIQGEFEQYLERLIINKGRAIDDLG